MRKLIPLALLVLFVVLLGKSWHIAKDGFHVGRVREAFLPLVEEEVPLEVKSALKQPYFYLGRGHQCYAFSSSDEKYVLKLPRLDRYELPFWMKACSFLDSIRKKKYEDVERRFQFILQSFQIAFHELKKETAVLYLHLNQTNQLPFSLLCKDRVGRTYSLPLDRTPFILQEKKPLMMPLFDQALQRGDREGAKRILEAFLDLVAARAKKGIFNKDPSFLRNFGFDGEKGIQIDIGSFYRKKDIENASQKSFQETVSHVDIWLNKDKEMQEWFRKKAERASL